MKYPRLTLILTIIATAAAALPLRAGTLDQAPFQIIAPSTDWKVDDSVLRQIAKDCYLLASVKNAQGQLISLVSKSGPFPPSAMALEDSCVGFRGSLANRGVKPISDTEATFLGYRSRFFACETTGQAGQVTYSETVIFVIGDTVWSIACYGPSAQKEAIKQMSTFFRKKA